MFRFTTRYNWHCRWCGKPYKTRQAVERAGFCSVVCKQAHYRAYKKYKEGVTQKKDLTDRAGSAGKVSNAKQGRKKTAKAG